MPDVIGPPAEPLTERVVLVILSGVSNHDLDALGDPWRFVQLRRRAAEGAYGMVEGTQPSGDAPTWATLISGADPSATGVVDENEWRELPVPTIFELARQGGIRSTVIASRSAWQGRQAVARPDRVELASSATAVDQTVVDVLAERQEQLAVVLLDAGRAAGIPPAERWQRLDQQFAGIAALLDPRQDTLIVTSDHGLLPDGATGGGDRGLIDLPIVMWGRAVVPGSTRPAAQQDIAPTVAALLGLPYGGYVGRPLLETLDLTTERRARELIRLGAPRIQARLAAGDGAASASRLLDTAREAGEDGRWNDAETSANEALALLQRQPQPSRYWASSWLWGLGVPLLLLGLGRLVGRFRQELRRLFRPALGLAGYLLVWSAIFYLLAGKRLSLSAIYGDWRANLFEVGLWSALALAVVAVGVGLMEASRGAAGAASQFVSTTALTLGSLAGFAVLYILTAGLPGPELPNLTGWTALLLALAQAAGAGLATPATLLLVATVSEVIGRGR